MWILAVSGHFSTILCLGLGVEKCIENIVLEVECYGTNLAA